MLPDLFEVEIDLTSKRMISARLDGEKLTPSEALILCWFNTIAMNHVKIHALANWFIDLDCDKLDPFVKRNGLVTAIYNYFGYTSFVSFFCILKAFSLLDEDWNPSSLIKCFDIGVEENIWSHPDIAELCPHSDFIRFITHLHPIFMKQFSRHQAMFPPGTHGESLFAGTVLHSLDHTLMEKNLEDPLLLDVDDARFGKMAQLGRILQVGFVPDIDGLYFHKRFKGSGHPFYENVYRRASKINREFADNMDTCIIK